MLQAPLIIWFSEQKNAKSETIARNSSDGLKPADFLRDYIKTEGNLTSEQQALIDSLIARMQNQTGSLKIEINEHKNKIKIEIKQRTNKTETEIENEIEDIEREHNITNNSTEKSIEKANEKILEAKEEIVKLMDEVGINNVTDNAVLVLMNNSFDKLDAAQNALNASKYGDAYGLANAAKQLAENAREKIMKSADFKLSKSQESDFKIEKLTEKEDKQDGNKTHNETEDDKDKGRVCIQVITPAKNETSGECKTFPTPCDVPKGWKKVKNCANINGSNQAPYSFELPEGWEIGKQFEYKSAACQMNTSCKGVYTTWLSREHSSNVEIYINQNQANGAKCNHNLTGGNWICAQSNESEVLAAYEKIIESFKVN